MTGTTRLNPRRYELLLVTEVGGGATGSFPPARGFIESFYVVREDGAGTTTVDAEVAATGQVVLDLAAGNTNLYIPLVVGVFDITGTLVEGAKSRVLLMGDVVDVVVAAAGAAAEIRVYMNVTDEPTPALGVVVDTGV